MPRYVIYRDDPNNHKEVYFKDFVNSTPQSTRDVAEAREFPNAETAYEFGDVFGLGWWKVGQR